MALRTEFLNLIVRDNNFFTDIFDFIAMIYSAIVSVGGAIVETLGFIGDVISWAFNCIRVVLNFLIESMVFIEWIKTGFFLPEIIVGCFSVLLIGIILKLVVDVVL